MKHKSLKMSDSFWQIVEDYRIKYSISWSEALIFFASVGIHKTMGIYPAKLPRRGGDHRSEKFRKSNNPAA